MCFTFGLRQQTKKFNLVANSIHYHILPNPINRVYKFSFTIFPTNNSSHRNAITHLDVSISRVSSRGEKLVDQRRVERGEKEERDPLTVDSLYFTELLPDIPRTWWCSGQEVRLRSSGGATRPFSLPPLHPGMDGKGFSPTQDGLTWREEWRWQRNKRRREMDGGSEWRWRKSKRTREREREKERWKKRS